MLKRKRTAIEKDSFERGVRVKLTPFESNPVYEPKVIKISFLSDRQVAFKKSNIKTTMIKSKRNGPPVNEMNNANTLLQKLLILENQRLKEEESRKRLGITAPKKISESQEKFNMMKKGSQLVSMSSSAEGMVNSELKGLVQARNCLDELGKLEDAAKEELRRVMIGKMTLGSEMQAKLDFMKQAIHQGRLNLGEMRKLQIEKRQTIKGLAEHVQKTQAQIARVEFTSNENNQRLSDLCNHYEYLGQEIEKYKENLQVMGNKVVDLNYEYFKENNIIRMLKEQIHCVKGGPKAIGIVVPLNINNNPFEYETYFKLTNTQTISLTNSDKFSVKLSTISPGKKHTSMMESSLKWVYSSSSFSLDKLIYDTKQMGFYNYDHNKKLYAEIEFFLKLSLYGDGETILRKISFNRPVFKKILGIDKFSRHMNIDSHVHVEEREIENIPEPGMHLTPVEQNCLLNNFASTDNKSVIFFFGNAHLHVASRLSENIYNEIINFENEIIKVNEIKLKIEFLDKETQRQECEGYETFGDFMNAFEAKAETEMYQNLLVVTFVFEMNSKFNDYNYTKKLHLIFMDVVNIENFDRFVRQFKAILNREKIITAKDRNLERIENYMKGVNRFLMIGELPNLIKKGYQAQEDYIKIRNLLDLMIKIKK